MKGARAVPSVKTIKIANSNKMKIIGANTHFFLSLKKSQNSRRIDIFDIFSLLDEWSDDT